MIKQLSDHTFLTFGTPVLKKQLADYEKLNVRLREIILAKEQSLQSHKYSNHGGWHSESDFFTWPEDEIQQLFRWVQASVHDMMSPFIGQEKFEIHCQVSGWANINREHDLNKVHAHPNHHWSGVYYVCLGAAKDNDFGNLYFLDPRPGATIYPVPNTKIGHDLVFKPESGVMYLFPSWLLHGVMPFKGQGERISISFNIKVHDVTFETN